MRHLLILALLFISCSKNSNSDQQPEQTPKDPLKLSSKLVGTWKLTAKISNPAFDYTGDGVPESDVYAALPSCYKNLGFTCNQNGTGVLDFNCSIKLPTKWQVTDISKIFRYNFSTDGGASYGADVKDTIIELTNTKLVYRYAHELGAPGTYYTVTETYSKQE